MMWPLLLFFPMIVLLILLLSVVDAQTGTNGTINMRFWIVQANNPSNAKTVTYGNFPSGQIVNVSSNTNFTNNPLGLVIPTRGSFFQLSMTTSMLTPNVMTKYDDRNVLYAVGQDKGNNFTEIKDLKVNGVKTVFIEGYDSVLNVYTTFNLTFTIIGGTDSVNPATTQSPSSRPSSRPSAKPSSQPSKRPVVPVTIYVPITAPPSAKPVAPPSQKPSTKPSSKPNAKPSSKPSTKPSSKPSARPSSRPSAKPSVVTARTGTTGTITKRFRIVQANTPRNAKVVTYGNYPSGQIVNISSNVNFTNNPLGLVIATQGSFYQLSMTTSMLTPNVMTTYVDRNALYAVGEDNSNNFTEIKDLKVNGVKTVFIQGYDSLLNVYATFNLTFTITGGTNPVGNKPPTPAPVKPPTPAPVKPPTNAPISIIVPPPTPPAGCDWSTVPQLSGTWENWMPPLPTNLVISHGGIINGNDFIVFGGYNNGWSWVTNQVFAYNLSATGGTTWRNMDNMPITNGLTHGAYVMVNNTMYVCGGFLSAVQNIATNQCWKYVHTNPTGSQWSSFTNLPGNRAGGALFYNKARNSLLFTSGTGNNSATTTDYDDVYEYSFANPGLGWQVKMNLLPYKANRVSFVTVNYQGLGERHYVMGGQSGTNENWGNQKNMYEYVVANDTWITRASMKFERGHFTSATLPWQNCGILIANGQTNGGAPTSDISYYSITTDTWQKIGDLPKPIRTTVCDIFGEYLYCQSGDFSGFSVRTKFGPPKPPTPAPVRPPTPPTPVPTKSPTKLISGSCPIPTFIPKNLTSWQYFPQKPGKFIAEAMGGFIGQDFLLFGGFDNSWDFSTNFTWSYSTVNQTWTRKDNIPSLPSNFGVTHMANIVVGNILYGCGAFLGGVSGRFNSTTQCFVYNHTSPPGKQWSSLPPLPEPRAGGGLLYDQPRNSLIFATGIDDHYPEVPRITDHSTVWELLLNNTGLGWVSKADIPYAANHVGATTVNGRHFVLGGQNGTNEFTGNYANMYEYNATSDKWTQRASLLKATGHISSSTIPYKDCGLLVLGGAHNDDSHTSDVIYYNLASNSWTKILQLPEALNTPVCSMLGDWLYCESGAAFHTFSWKILLG